MALQSYKWAQYAATRNELAGRLGDPNKVHWIDDELKVYVTESLRTWQCLTGYWRDRAVMNGTVNQPWYDITGVLTPKLRSYNVTDTQVVASLQYVLLENAGQVAPGSGWVGTDMFNLADVTTSLTRRRDQFIEATGCTLKVNSPLPISPTQPRYGLPDDTVIDIRRMALITGYAPSPYGKGTYGTAIYSQGSISTRVNLWRQDEWQSNAYNPGWAAAASVPQTFTVATTPVLTFAFGTPPASSGSVELVTVNSGATLNPAAGVLLGVPDDWTWVIRWGVLSDLLDEDGQAPDPQRAQYAEQRWQQGLELARVAPAILACQLNGSDRFPTPISDADLYNPGWQNVTGVPNQLLVAGMNLIALSPVPTSAPSSATLDVAENAPLPVADADLIQLGREEMDAVLGYAEHLASFKLGGDEFLRTAGLYQNFFQQASVYTNRLAAYSPSAREMSATMHKATEKVLRRASDVPNRPAAEVAA